MGVKIPFCHSTDDVDDDADDVDVNYNDDDDDDDDDDDENTALRNPSLNPKMKSMRYSFF